LIRNVKRGKERIALFFNAEFVITGRIAPKVTATMRLGGVGIGAAVGVHAKSKILWGVGGKDERSSKRRVGTSFIVATPKSGTDARRIHPEKSLIYWGPRYKKIPQARGFT